MSFKSLLTFDRDVSTRKRLRDNQVLDHITPRKLVTYKRGGGIFGDSDLDDPTKYDEVPLSIIKGLWVLFHAESILITIFQISANGLIGSGFLFQHGEYFLDNNASRDLRQYYSNFTRDLLKNAFIYGFAVGCLEDHPTLKAIPRVVDLRLVKTRVKRDFLGENHYLFYPLKSDLSDPPPLEGLYVFELDKPDGATLRSRLFSLQQDFELYRLARHCFATATQVGSDPVRMLQPEKEVVDESSLRMGFVPPEEIGGNANPAPIRLNSEARESAERQIQSVNNINRGLHPNAGSSSAVDRNTNTFRIKQGYTLVKQQMPMVVDLAAISARLEERAATVFSVPRNLFSQSASGRALAADAENTENTFKEGQRGLKMYVLNACHILYNAVNGDEFTRSVLKNMPEEELLGDKAQEALETKAQLTVSLPTLPSSETMRELYVMGVLKYEAFLHSVTGRDSLPIKWFNDTPKLDIADLAGIKPDPPPAASSSSGKAKPKPVPKKPTPHENMKFIKQTVPKK